VLFPLLKNIFDLNVLFSYSIALDDIASRDAKVRSTERDAEGLHRELEMVEQARESALAENRLGLNTKHKSHMHRNSQLLSSMILLLNFILVGFEVLMVASMKVAVFWVIAPCSLVEIYQRFRGTCCSKYL
jgi:hypothetical protein